jgi:hypothetical protein
MSTTPTTEPVLREAAVTSVVTQVSLAATALGVVFGVDLEPTQKAAVAASAAVVGLVNAIVTAWRAWRARQQVTPV